MAHKKGPAIVTKYQERISGPLLDRMDIHMEVPCVDQENFRGIWLVGTTASIGTHVQAV